MGNPILRITQTALGDDRHHVEVSLEGDGLPRQAARSDFEFRFSDQEQENLRWYLEDYLQHVDPPAPQIAAAVERRMIEVGVGLFKAVFQSSDDARDLWATLRARLEETRVEIITEVREAASVPWELIRDPKTDVPLALRARSFVRAHPTPVQVPKIPDRAEALRILLVICRPGRGDDVPFRSVASRILKGLGAKARKLFELDVLRPATFEKLAEAVKKKHAAGEPYHVVHFDGHGAFVDVERLFDAWGKSPTDEALQEALRELGIEFDPARFSPELIYPQPRRPGKRGYLVFENPASDRNLRLVDGTELGQLLAGSGVPVLVLNACKSAYAEAPEAPEQAPRDVHAQVRAFGTLAQEVMDSGVTGVVAMRYNVYVVTAAQLVADLYAALVEGQTLGEALSAGRRQLAANPLRAIAYQPRPLQDWPVPVVYEAAPLALLSRGRQTGKITLEASPGAAGPGRGQLDPDLPPRPDVGFFGRDETLLALDRAFDTQRIVLLHAYAGSGKTATAAEFARWYDLTGGIEGPVLFTSFEQPRPLPRVLDVLGRVFGPVLEQNDIHWLALSDDERRQMALQILRQVPVFWIWDNVEPVGGFPAGTPSAYSPAEQQALADFLRAARETQAKFLLTSRRDERAWLVDLPARIAIPGMPMQERVQLARALADRHQKPFTEVEDWLPLLRFTGGNPLTITVVVGQALRDGLHTREQIEWYVGKLRAGEAAFQDEASEGRTRSLGASLSYGFSTAFTDAERGQLALLHFFQGFVDVDALKWMGDPKSPGCLPELGGLTRQAGIALLDRAAEIGLLTAHGGGYYTIHPALPWYFKDLFDQYFPPLPPGEGHLYSPLPSGEGLGVRESGPAEAAPAVRAARAFVEAIGGLGNYYWREYEHGNRDVIALLKAEEANLLHARRLARANAWWGAVIGPMQGLQSLYEHTGRRGEWAQLVGEIVPDFVDPQTDAPLPGREDQWDVVTQYRVRLAGDARQWAETQRLQKLLVEWTRRRAAPALAMPPERLDDGARNAIRTLAMSLGQLGNIQRDQANGDCVSSYEDAGALLQRIGDRAAEAVHALNLGHAYLQVPAIRDLKEAERWYRRSLDLRDPRDRLGRGKCLSQLGLVARQRFQEARAAGQQEEALRQLNAAAGFYHEALDLTPPDALESLATKYNQLGNVYAEARQLDRALHHWREAIRYRETAGDTFGAGGPRFNVGLALGQAGRFDEALLYAEAALRDFETFGDRAAADIQKTQRLIAEIQRDRGSPGG